MIRPARQNQARGHPRADHRDRGDAVPPARLRQDRGRRHRIRTAHVARQRVPLLPLQDRDRPGDLPALPERARREGLDDRAFEGARRASAWSGSQLEIFAYHKENLLEEQKVNDIVLVAMEESWDAIMAHKEVIRTAMELILRDGIEAGEFEPVDPRETSALIMQGLCRLLPSGPDRPRPAGRPRSRNRSTLADPLPAARHHPPKVVPP